MGVNKLKLAVFVMGSLTITAAAVTISQMRKHGGHITVGIGSRELGWYFDGKRKDLIRED